MTEVGTTSAWPGPTRAFAAVMGINRRDRSRFITELKKRRISQDRERFNPDK